MKQKQCSVRTIVMQLPSVVCNLAVGNLSVNCWPTVGRQIFWGFVLQFYRKNPLMSKTITFIIDTIHCMHFREGYIYTYLYDGEMWDILHRLNSSVKGQSKHYQLKWNLKQQCYDIQFCYIHTCKFYVH